MKLALASPTAPILMNLDLEEDSDDEEVEGDMIPEQMSTINIAALQKMVKKNKRNIKVMRIEDLM